MFTSGAVRHLINIMVLMGMLASPLSPLISQAAAYYPEPGDQTPDNASTLYRTTITLRQPGDLIRVEKLGVTLLTKSGEQWTTDHEQTTILADEEQLASLARLGFKPEGTSALPALIPHQQIDPPDSPSLDDDADGLTNTQEQWWCTDPLDADSDNDGATDGAEVTALKAWLGNQTGAPPAAGKPFVGWPADHPGCYDDDLDSIPDQAELWELGLNPNRESTDRDKFDDGQELFGNTYCPGSGGYCGYGLLPRDADWGVVLAEMPSWVEAPGNHPLVAAFPVPEVDVVESSLHVETVTVVTTDHVTTEGTETSYSTSETEGTSTSVADTVTWSEWQEFSVTTPVQGQSGLLSIQENWFKNLFSGEVEATGTMVNQGCAPVSASLSASGGLASASGSAAASGCINNTIINNGDVKASLFKNVFSFENVDFL